MRLHLSLVQHREEEEGGRREQLCVLLPLREDGEQNTSTCLLSLTDNLFSCPLTLCGEKILYFGRREEEAQQLGVEWAGPVSLPGQARPSQAVPAPQRASVQRGTWGQDAWPRISYHSEFCSCHWHLARGNNGRDNSRRHRPPVFLCLSGDTASGAHIIAIFQTFYFFSHC